MNKLNEWINTIQRMDCLEGMQQLPDGCIDLIVTDPPYGIGESMKNHKSRGINSTGFKKELRRKQLAVASSYKYSEWDKKRPDKNIFDEMFRISKNQIIFGGNYFSDYLKPSSCWIVWDKDNGNNDFADCELVWTSFNSAVRKFKWKWHGMLQEDMKNKEKRYHPTQKPLRLIVWLLQKFSKPNDLILDPFMGSGTTAVACKMLDRRFIGFEISEEYCKIARERIDKVPKRLDKFFPNKTIGE